MLLIGYRFDWPVDDPAHLLLGGFEEDDTNEGQDHERYFHNPNVLETRGESLLEGRQGGRNDVWCNTRDGFEGRSVARCQCRAVVEAVMINKGLLERFTVRKSTATHMKAASEETGSPAPTAAGTIYFGKFSVSLPLTILVAIATPMTPPNDFSQKATMSAHIRCD